MKFRDLPIGAHFKFSPGVWSFSRVVKKVSNRCYVYAERKNHTVKLPHGWHKNRWRHGLMKACVGSTNVGVQPTGRRSPLKKRQGRGRGSATYGRR